MSKVIEFNSNSKFLIRKNMKGILDITLEEINDFKQPSQNKLKSISVLLNLVKACGSLLSPHLERILNTLYNYIETEEEISRKCEETAQILGLCNDQNVIIPLIIKHLSETELKNSYQPMYCRLKLLSNVLNKIVNINKENTDSIINLITNLDIFNIPSEAAFTKKILAYTYYLFNALVLNLGQECKTYHDSLFFSLLLLGSLPDTVSLHMDVKKTLQILSENCGHSSIEQLYSVELAYVLEKFNTTHKKWRKNSPDRFAFDTYVRNGGIALDNHWIDILMIISQSCEADRDLEMRIDMMVLLENILDSQEIYDQIKSYIEFILPEILLPASRWKALRPNNKVRKASLVCLIKLFRNNLIEVETAITFFKDILVVLKSTLEDDWDPEMRFLSINLLKNIISFCKGSIDELLLLEVYPYILKRLDDSQDTNRIHACEVFQLFFEICQKVRISETTYEYILTTSFIHLDDPNENVRKAVLAFLIEAKKVYREVFMKVVERNVNNFVHKSILKELVD